MATIPHDPATPAHDAPRWSVQLRVPEMWAGLAIISMWVAVLFDALFGPSMVFDGVAGDSSTIPSVVPVAGCAFLATWLVAAYAFRRRT